MPGHLIATVVVAAITTAVCPPAARLAWSALRAVVSVPLIALAEVVERRRARRAPPTPPRPAVPPARPTPQPATERRWHVRLSTRINGQLVTLADGEVAGPWAPAVRAEALARWAEATGQPASRIYAQAWPVLTRGRAA